MSSSDDSAATADLKPTKFGISAERRRVAAMQFCLRRWWPISIFLAASVSLYSGLELELAVVLFVLSFGGGATASYLAEWAMIGRAFVEVYPDGTGTVRNRYKQWSGRLDPRVTVGPLSDTWSWNGVWVGVTDESGRATRMVGAVAIDPNAEGSALAEILRSTYPG